MKVGTFELRARGIGLIEAYFDNIQDALDWVGCAFASAVEHRDAVLKEWDHPTLSEDQSRYCGEHYPLRLTGQRRSEALILTTPTSKRTITLSRQSGEVKVVVDFGAEGSIMAATDLLRGQFPRSAQRLIHAARQIDNALHQLRYVAQGWTADPDEDEKDPAPEPEDITQHLRSGKRPESSNVPGLPDVMEEDLSVLPIRNRLAPNKGEKEER